VLLPPPAPPPSAVTFTAVVEAGTVNVPGEENVVARNCPPPAAADVHVVPFDVSTLPDEPGATN
jgi:hypothetical protein